MQVLITSPDRAIQAGTWANNNLKHKWEISMPRPFSNDYYFEFTDEKEATLFALKWVQ